MGISSNNPDPMEHAKKWLSVGAGAGAVGFILTLYWLGAGLGLSASPLMLMLVIPLLAVAWAVLGAGFISRESPEFLGRLPATALIGLGLVLGGVFVIIGAI